MSTLPIRAYIASPSVLQQTRQKQRQRHRGTEGFKEAAERGVIDGTGVGGGIKPKGRDVVIYGFPGSIAAPALRLYLRREGLVKMAKNGEPDCEVVKVEV